MSKNVRVPHVPCIETLASPAFAGDVFFMVVGCLQWLLRVFVCRNTPCYRVFARRLHSAQNPDASFAKRNSVASRQACDKMRGPPHAPRKESMNCRRQNKVNANTTSTTTPSKKRRKNKKNAPLSRSIGGCRMCDTRTFLETFF